eukprot:jgi/Mesvir1/17299/Mv07698-RA.1
MRPLITCLLEYQQRDHTAWPAAYQYSLVRNPSLKTILPLLRQPEGNMQRTRTNQQQIRNRGSVCRMRIYRQPYRQSVDTTLYEQPRDKGLRCIPVPGFRSLSTPVQPGKNMMVKDDSIVVGRCEFIKYEQGEAKFFVVLVRCNCRIRSSQIPGSHIWLDNVQAGLCNGDDITKPKSLDERTNPINSTTDTELGRQFKSFQTGRLLVTHPSNVNKQSNEALPQDLAIVLLTEREAWGTGEHPTTRLCLKYLAETIKGGERILDYGCGTGVLSLAALKLGAASALAIDVVHEAVATTIFNRQLNNIPESRLVAIQNEMVPMMTLSCDICLANMLLPEQVGLVTDIAAAVRPGGTLCMSGLVQADIDDARRLYAHYFAFGEPVLEQHPHTGVFWARLVGVRGSNLVGGTRKQLEDLSESAL